MSDREQLINQITKKLQHVSEKQYENERTISEQEQAEQDFFEMKGHFRRLFNRLFDMWHKDKGLSNWLEQKQLEVQHYERKIDHELENNQERLLQEKRQLNDLENDLYNQRQSLVKGGE
ncbi:DUF3958 family protein [Neobacillus vireti]|uniref:DUF3958 family protein n=1 Tax=Neobacillus vireti TaxID=220686 RepID=UPI002FFF3115